MKLVAPHTGSVTEKVFMNKWQQLNDIGLSCAERKEINTL